MPYSGASLIPVPFLGSRLRRVFRMCHLWMTWQTLKHSAYQNEPQREAVAFRVKMSFPLQRLTRFEEATARNLTRPARSGNTAAARHWLSAVARSTVNVMFRMVDIERAKDTAVGNRLKRKEEPFDGIVDQLHDTNGWPNLTA